MNQTNNLVLLNDPEMSTDLEYEALQDNVAKALLLAATVGKSPAGTHRFA